LKHVKNNGFTIIEILIVTAIIGILAAVAIPAYNDHILTAKRTDGRGLLMTVMQAQERYFAENMEYTDDLTDLDYASATGVSSEQGYYSVAASFCGGTGCVLLTATGDATTDGNITLDSIGNKLPADQW